MLPLVCIAIALFLFAVDATEDSRDVLRSALLGHLKLTGPTQVDSAARKESSMRTMETFTAHGYVTSGQFASASCSDSDVLMMMGLSVNACLTEDSFSFKIRLVGDSCVGGKIEYFNDEDCSDSAGFSSLEVNTQCFGSGEGPYMRIGCTSKAEPSVYVESGVQEYFAGSNCGTSWQYYAITANKCMDIPTDDGDDNHDDGGNNNRATPQNGVVKDHAPSPLEILMTVPARRLQDTDEPSVEPTAAPTEGAHDGSPQQITCTNGRVTMRQYSPGSECVGTPEQEDSPPNTCNSGGDQNAQRSSLRSTMSDTAAEAQVAAAFDAALARSAAQLTSAGLAHPRMAKEIAHTARRVQNGDNDHDDHDDKPFPLEPPSSVSTTPFPPSAGPEQAFSMRIYCKSGPAKSTVSFTAAQTISGVSLATYNSDKAKYDKTLKQAIARAVPGATEDSVTDLVVKAGTSAAATTLAHHVFRLLDDNSIIATYKVTVEDTPLSAENLAGQLKSAVEAGSFTASMQEYAAENGATGLETATSDSVTTDSSSDEDDDEAVLETGAIIGIAVGGAAFLAICAAGVFMFTRSKSSVAPSN